MKEYSEGTELGLSIYLAISAIMMASKTLDMAETIEAPICKLFVMRTLLDMS
jgi:hypothetical protein